MKGLLDRRTRYRLLPYLLLAPSFVILGVILVYPSVYNAFLSVWYWRFTNPASRFFVGLENYALLLTDSAFQQAIKVTLTFTVGSVGLEFILGLITALLLAKKSPKVRRILSSLLILPYMVAGSVTGLIWRLLWQYDYGLVNHILAAFGAKPVQWLGDPSLAMVSVIVADTWRETPFVTLILLAGLMSIPQETYEASTVDGASAWQQFCRITLPLLMPAISVALLFRTIFAIRVFDVVFTLTRGGPGTATTPLGILLYKNTFQFFQGGQAAALAMVILLLGLVVSSLYIRLLYRRIEY